MTNHETCWFCSYEGYLPTSWVTDSGEKLICPECDWKLNQILKHFGEEKASDKRRDILNAKCHNWDSGCHLGTPTQWEKCQEQKGVECSELKFGWKHYPDSPFGDVDICPHGVCRTHGTQDNKCRWCGT